MIFDADSHVMEVEGWLLGYAEPGVREKLGSLGLEKAGKDAAALMSSLPALWERQRGERVSADVIAGPKGWRAPGALDPGVRSRVLDALGIHAQLVFPTFSLGQFARSGDPDVRYGGTRALNRAMAEFCGADKRLLAVGYLPLNEPGRAIEELDAALKLGVAAVWVPSEAPGTFSPAHVDLEPVWARLAEAGVPFVLHVGGGKLLPREFHENGRPRPVDWLGGGENLRGKDFPVLHHSPERFLACLVLDGVFHRHPQLRGAAIEQGANWVPGMLRNLDHAHRSFSRFEPLLQELSSSRRSTSAARCGSRRSRSRTRPGSSGSAVRSCSCSRPTTRTLRAGGGLSRSSATRWPGSATQRTTSSSGAMEPSISGWPDMAGSRRSDDRLGCPRPL